MATFSQFDSRTFDANLQLSDGQTFTTSAQGTVGGNAAKIDTLDAHFQGDAVIDLGTVLATAGNGNALLIQGSDSATFASGVVNLAILLVGDATVTFESVDDAGAARYIVPFSNVKKGVLYRYVRLWAERIASGSAVCTRAYVSKRA
jgi:hypothetical protein